MTINKVFNIVRKTVKNPLSCDLEYAYFCVWQGVFGSRKTFFDRKKDRQLFRNKFSEKNASFHRLLEYLMVAREHLKAEHPEILAETIDKLLIICIFIKFLEGIKEDDDNHVLSTVFEKHGVSDFAEALEKGKCIYILDELADKFNGSIFDNFKDEEKQQLKKADLKLAAYFLTAKLDIRKKHKQRFLWEQYTFNHLPAELISSVYENFLQKGHRKKGVIDTPLFLVDFLIDDVMPLDKAKEYFSQGEFKVLDPSCGSGIFLAAAYKRMLQWWSINHYEKTNKIEFPDKNVCQNILKNNIFGVDIHQTARLITLFSLTIALPDKPAPKEIWNNLKLNSLQDNIQAEDFFGWASHAKSEGKKFDLVIGNPPFNSKSGVPKKEAVSDARMQQFGISSKDIPYNNFALKFFEGAMFFGKKICLLLPSRILLYNKSASAVKYRNRIFTKYTIEKIFDFTYLRDLLFVGKNPEKTWKTTVCAVLAIPGENNGKATEHTVIRHLVHSEEKICFELYDDDRHFVRHDWAADETTQFQIKI